MSERDKQQYRKVKADPVRYAAFLERRRRQRARKRDYETARKHKWRLANPEDAQRIRQANHAVETALENGTLVKPKTCLRCGAEGPVQGHHPSYAKDQWLVVVWLCQTCHAREHHPEQSAA